MLKLKLKLQYFGHLMLKANSFKKTDAGKDQRPKEKGVAKDVMVRYHYRLNGHEFEQTPGDGKGQRSLACCSSWGCKGWKKHKLESRLLGEISVTSDMQMTPRLWQKVKRN